METFKNELKAELVNNILPYWINKMQDHENGGFYGRIDGKEILHKDASKGVVLNTRLLWTFSAAYRILKDPAYLAVAERAYQYIEDYFLDKEYGGVYWELDYKGNPLNTKKQIYAQGFALYGFSEFYRATGRPEALERAKDFFRWIEKYAYDPLSGGYWEAFTREWKPIEDVRLSAKDANEKKTMNTHLHVLEPYSNLLRVWRSPELEKAQRELIQVFLDKIIDPETFHLNLFFDDNWDCKSNEISYGHDIEASWLLFEAAEVLGNKELTDQVKSISLRIADASMEGLQKDGSMIYETFPDHTDKDRHWWVQAEAVVGLVYAWHNSGHKSYLDKAESCWKFIQQHIIDKENGEWFWSVDEQNHYREEKRDDKAGFWKCSYHNSRMCMEVMSLTPESLF